MKLNPAVSDESRDTRVRLFIDALIVLQGISAFYFLADFVTDIVTLSDSTFHVVIEGLAVLCLFIGIALSIRERRRLQSRNRAVEAQLQIASGAFQELMRDAFDRWKLTPSEREIALLTIKGFSNAEIAKLRKTSEGTVKAQSNAVFRKAEVSGRTQLLSHFIDELVGEPIVRPPDEKKSTDEEVQPGTRQVRARESALLPH